MNIGNVQSAFVAVAAVLLSAGVQWTGIQLFSAACDRFWGVRTDLADTHRPMCGGWDVTWMHSTIMLLNVIAAMIGAWAVGRVAKREFEELFTCSCSSERPPQGSPWCLKPQMQLDER